MGKDCTNCWNYPCTCGMRSQMLPGGIIDPDSYYDGKGTKNDPLKGHEKLVEIIKKDKSIPTFDNLIVKSKENKYKTFREECKILKKDPLNFSKTKEGIKLLNTIIDKEIKKSEEDISALSKDYLNSVERSIVNTPEPLRSFRIEKEQDELTHNLYPALKGSITGEADSILFEKYKEQK